MKTLELSDEQYAKVQELLLNMPKPVEELSDLIGQTITFFCTRYIYNGKVKAINNSFITLKDAGIVYETGELDANSPADLQKLHNDLYIMLQSIENFTQMKW